MSELHSILGDPGRKGESTLSILLWSGDAAYTFQQEIYRYLNISDALRLRRTNKLMNQIVRGETRDILTYHTPHVAAVESQNSTLRLLGVRCYGKLLPAHVDCPVRPLDEVNIKSCTGVKPPLDPNGVQRCRGDICTACAEDAAHHLRESERNRMDKGHEIALCRRCQLYEVRRHPGGF